jgi:group I intron endonuclease
MYHLYVYRNIINDKLYIGQTNNLSRRKSQHEHYVKKGSNQLPYLYNAMRHYGIENFEFIPIFSSESLEEINYMERQMILLLNAKWKEDGTGGYNIAFGGDNRKLSQETKDKISIRQKEYQKNNKNNMLGKHHTEEAKKKISDGRIGKYDGKNSAFYGKHHTQESKNIMSVKRKGKFSGEKSSQSKLTNQEANEIRRLFLRENKTKKELAIIYNVSVSCVINILKNVSYCPSKEKPSQEMLDAVRARKLTNIQKEQIKTRLTNGEAISQLAAEYNVAYQTIYKILKTIC